MLEQDEIQAPLSAEASALVKQNPKGGFTVPGNVPLGPKETADLLARMQEMVDQRSSPLNLLLSGLKDASAAAVPNLEGQRTESISRRDAQKAAEAQELFRMRSDMATLRSAQEAATSRAKSLKDEVTGGVPSGTTTNEAAVPSRLAMPPKIANEINRLLNLNPPDLAGAEAVRKEYIKNESKFDPARYEQKTYYINPEIGNVNMDAEQAEYFKRTNILPDGTKVRAPTKAITFSDPSINIISAKRTAEKGQELWDASVKNGTPGIQPNGLPVAKPGTSPHEAEEGSAYDIDPKKLTRSGRTELAQKGYYQPMGIDSPHWERIPGFKSAAATTAKTVVPELPSQRAELSIAKTAPAGNQDLPYPVPRNAEQVTANQKFIEERGKKSLEISSKGPEKASTEAGTRQAQMFKLNEEADDAIKAADQVIAASISHPESVGLGKGLTGANFATTAISALPKMDQNKAEDRFASFVLTKPEQQAARDQVDTASKQLGISFAADVFKGARLGIGLENMAAGAKGVSVHNLAENNLINAKIIKEAALFNKARTKLFKEEWAPKNGGEMASFEKFETSPEYNELKEKTQKRILQSLPDYLKLTKDGLVPKNAREETTSSKFDKFKKKKED